MQKLAEWLEAGPRDARLVTSELEIADSAIARTLGYSTPQPRPMPAHVADTVARLRPLAERLIDGRAAWTAVSAQVLSDSVLCDRPRGSRLAVGEVVAGQLRHSHAVAVFVTTIGDALECEVRRLMAAGDPLDGFILDAIGSVATDACADAVVAAVAGEAEVFGWKFTNRYSPGYCTWDTADQCGLFALLPHAPVGVRLTTSGLMQPLKSISGVLGVGTDVKFTDYACAFCGAEDCRQRLAAVTE